MPPQRHSPFLLSALLLLSPPLWAAERADTVQRRISSSDYEGARSRCERWEAWNAMEEPELREVCAKAYWPLMEARDTAEVWAAYRERWAGTDWANVALDREASASLRELPANAPEADLLQLAEDYPDTRAAREAIEMAAEAAIRDVNSPEAAVRAAQRYPTHPSLPAFVERYTEAFVSAFVEADQSVRVTIEPPVSLPPYMTPTPVWVARWPGGHAEPWTDVATQHLVQSGVPPERIRPAGAGPGLPLCFLSGQPEGWHVAVEIRVGAGRVYRPMPWDARCGPDALPVALGVSANQVVGLSFSPTRRVDLTTRLDAGRPHARDYAPVPPAGDPLLSGPQVYLPAGRVYVVYPLNGGPPWLTDRPPSRDGQPVTLGAALVGSGPPAGAALVSGGGGLVLRRTTAAGTEDWPMPPGEVRFLSPLVQRVLGLDDSPATPAGAPALSAMVPWVRDGRAVLPSPPQGASSAPLRALSPEDLAAALLRVASVGLPTETLQVIDGWAASLDGDSEDEFFLRVLVGSRKTVLVLDVDPVLGNRLFATETPTIPPAAGAWTLPFAFVYGGHRYLAWLGPASTAGASLEVVRFDGQSFRTEAIQVSR